MFKNILLLLVIFISSSVFAQLSINSSGHTTFSGNTTTSGVLQ